MCVFSSRQAKPSNILFSKSGLSSNNGLKELHHIAYRIKNMPQIKFGIIISKLGGRGFINDVCSLFVAQIFHIINEPFAARMNK